MRTLELSNTDEGRDRYRLLYQALVFGPTNLSRADLRQHGKLLDKLEAIGVAGEEKTTLGESLFELRIGVVVPIALEDAEHALLVRMFSEAIPHFRKAKSRVVLACIEWLEKIPEDKG